MGDVWCKGGTEGRHWWGERSLGHATRASDCPPPGPAHQDNASRFATCSENELRAAVYQVLSTLEQEEAVRRNTLTPAGTARSLTK